MSTSSVGDVVADGGRPDDLIDHSPVIICCGAGGVGKTTTAAVLGLEAARRGRRAVVVTIDPARRLADALGLADGLGPEPQLVDLSDRSVLTGEGAGVAGELWAMMLDAKATFDGVVRRHAGDEEQAERILANAFYRNIAAGLSGTHEYMAAEMLHMLHDDPRFDLVIVDTPPSRNALDFLEAPRVLSRFLDHRLFKLLMLPTRGGFRIFGAATQPIVRAIGTVVGSEVLADSVTFFQAFAGMEAGFRERAEQVVALLRDPGTSFVVVASPHVETVAEAVWFAEQLAGQGVDVDAYVVNRAQPAFGDGTADTAEVEAAARAARGDAELAALWSNLAHLRRRREAELTTLQALIDIAGTGGISILPLLDGDVHDLAGLSTMAGHLFEQRPMER